MPRKRPGYRVSSCRRPASSGTPWRGPSFAKPRNRCTDASWQPLWACCCWRSRAAPTSPEPIAKPTPHTAAALPFDSVNTGTIRGRVEWAGDVPAAETMLVRAIAFNPFVGKNPIECTMPHYPHPQWRRGKRGRLPARHRSGHGETVGPPEALDRISRSAVARAARGSGGAGRLRSGRRRDRDGQPRYGISPGASPRGGVLRGAAGSAERAGPARVGQARDCRIDRRGRLSLAARASVCVRAPVLRADRRQRPIRAREGAGGGLRAGLLDAELGGEVAASAIRKRASWPAPSGPSRRSRFKRLKSEPAR